MFLAANLAVILISFALFVAPVLDFFLDRDAYVAQQRVLLARLTAIVAREPSVQAATRKAAEEPKRGEFLVGPNEGVINADLQTRLKTMAEQAGARLRSVQGLPPKTNEQVRYVGSRLEISGPLRAIHRALYAVESGRPYLFVTSAVIKPSRSLNGPAAREEPITEAQLDVFGAVQVEERNQ